MPCYFSKLRHAVLVRLANIDAKPRHGGSVASHCLFESMFESARQP